MAETQETQKEAPWQAQARELAQQWAAGLKLEFLGVDVVKLLEYPMLDALNRRYEKNRDEPVQQ